MYCFYASRLSLIPRRTRRRIAGLVEFCATALRERDINSHSSDGKCKKYLDVQFKSKTHAAYISAVFKHRDSTWRASRAHSLSKSHLVIFLLSTVCHFYDDGIRRRKIGAGEGDSWQMAASAVIHQIWINRRPLAVLSFSIFLLSLLLPLLLLSSYLLFFFTFLCKVVCYWTYRVCFYRKWYFRCQDFSLLSRQATRVVAQIVVIRTNVITFAPNFRDYPGNRVLSEWNWHTSFLAVHAYTYSNNDFQRNCRRRFSF